MLNSLAQEFRISSATLSSDRAQLAFPGRSDSYYLLHAASSLSVPSSPVGALLGANESQLFQSPLTNNTMFFRVEQIPLSSPASVLGDGIPDAWKLQHQLNPLVPGIASQIPLGGTRTWLQLYQADASAAQLPLAYFPQTALTNIVGGSNLTIPVAFTKPFTGLLSFQLSGTAIPESGDGNGDYYPINSVNVISASQATISIGLVPRVAVESDRTLVVALAAPSAANSYWITNGTSVCAVRLAQSLQGIYLGTLNITNGLYLGSQSVKMAFRPAASGATAACFDVSGNPLLGDSFTVPATLGVPGPLGNTDFQLSGAYSRQLTNTPFGRPLQVTLAFGPAQSRVGSSYSIPVTLSVTGLTASGRPYLGAGNMTLIRAQ